MSNERSKQVIASLKLEDDAIPTQYEITQAKKAKYLFLNPTDSRNNRAYREAIFARTYIPILLEIFADNCTGVDEIETEIGTCFQINLNGGGKVYDYGSQVKIENGTEEEIRVAVKLAVGKGWPGLHLTGSDAFKSQAFLQAVLSGAFRPDQITGYKPTKTDLEVIQEWPEQWQDSKMNKTIKSYVVEKSEGDSSGGGEERIHVPRLKI